MEETKSAVQLIQEVCEVMCMEYCKWPEKWDDADGELCDSDHCQNCPLNKLN